MKIQINGEIVDTRFGDAGFAPADMKAVLEGVDDNEPLEVEITSEGGSVFAGLQIANLLARRKGEVTTHAVGFVASIATVILMAGKKVVADENCFCLVHNPWTAVQGNANDLAKEIETLEKCKDAMMGFYRKHSLVNDAELSQYLDDETWFTGKELAAVFDVAVLPCDQRLDIAAKFDLSKYRKLPKGIAMNEKEETTTPAAAVEAEEPKTETETAAAPAAAADTDDIEELRQLVKILREEKAALEAQLAECQREKEAEGETVTKAECEKRVSGMQASMQKQINDFSSQLKAKDEELMKAKADITSLTESLENAKGELSATASALAEKTTALERLNASVNAQAEELPTLAEGLAKCATPAERVAFLKSGKYIR